MSDICKLCPLHKDSKINMMSGVGPQPSKILFIGEGPGEREEQEGTPFVGASGQLLDQLLFSAGIDKTQARISNIVRCRPTDREKSWEDRRGHTHYGNRAPTLEEIYTCAPSYLEQEIKDTKPNVIVPVGAIALKYLSDEFKVDGYDQKDGMFVPKLTQNGKKSPGITKERGIERWSEKYQCKIIPCVTGDSEVLTSFGIQTVKNIIDGRLSISINSVMKNLKIDGSDAIVDFIDSGKKPVFELKTSAGKNIKATANHLFLTRDGWVPLKNLVNGIEIATPACWRVDGVRFSPSKMKILGYLIGDGCTTKGTSFFITTRKEILKDFTFHLKAFNHTKINPWGRGSNCYYISGIAKSKRIDPGFSKFLAGTGLSHAKLAKLIGVTRESVEGWLRGRWGIRRTAFAQLKKVFPKASLDFTNESELNLWIDDLGLRGKRANVKFIPEFVFGCDKTALRSFIEGLFLTDGCIFVGRERSSDSIFYISTSYRLIKQLQYLLLRFGLVFKIKNRSCYKRKSYHSTEYWLETKNKTYIKRFCDVFTLLGKKKKKLDQLRRYYRGVKPTVLQEGDVYWDRVVSKRFRGIKPVYDVTVSKNHNFVANGIVVHNCIHPSALLRGSRLLNTTVEDLKRIRASAETKEIVRAPEGQYVVADTWDLVDWVFERLKDVSEFAIDLETTGLDWMRDEITYIGFSWKEGTGVSIPILKEDGTHLWSSGEEAVIYSTIDQLYSDPSKCKIGHNHLKFDQHMLMGRGVRFPINVYDTMLAHHLLDSDSAHGLKDLTWVYFSGMGGYENEYVEAEKFCLKEKKKRYAIPRKIAAKYNSVDCDMTLRLKHIFEQQMKVFPQMEKLFQEWIPEIAECALDTERVGIAVDFDLIRDLYDKMGKHKKLVSDEFSLLVGSTGINLGSSKQLCKIFFEDKKMPIIKEGKSGPSFDEDVVLELKKQFPQEKALDLVIQHRRLSKDMSTYLEGVKDAALFGKSEISAREMSLYWNVDDARKAGYFSDGKVHCDFHLHTTATGRLSSRSPNLQNIRSVSEEDIRLGYIIKNIFVADAGCVLMEADLSQAELWILQSVSQDRALCEALESKDGIHYTTASKLFSVSINEVTDEKKTIAKRVVFGILYGQTAEALAQQQGLEIEVAQGYIQGWHDAYPAASLWISNTVEFAREHKYVVSPFGRIRHLPAIDSPQKFVREEAERQAVNHPPQSGASDATQIGAVKIMRAIRQMGLRSRRVITIHDSNMYNVPLEELEIMKALAKEKMEEFIPELGLGMHVKLETSARWKAQSEVTTA